MNKEKSGESNESDNEKIAVNFYISADVLEKIEEVMYYVRRRLPIKKRGKLSKSLFYEICLKVTAEDYCKKGEESVMWKVIQDQMKN